MSPVEPTRSRNPSDSILMTLARAMFDAESGPEPKSWPHLDLDDPVQREFGDYELLQELGRGGMGVVYRARQRSLDRDVAIKFIAAGMADTFNVTRFLAEARAAARLMHPNIVPVHEVGSIDGVHYFSMPLVKGRTLASLLESGPMPVAQAIRLMLKLCDAIDYAHRLGLLHLDLKPANVLIDERGEPLVADFGLARHMDERGGVDAQEVSGTPSFMAPEQILIKQYRLTSATDIYALGALLYRCVAGVSPHGEGSPDELIQCAVAGRVQPLQDVVPDVPADLVAVTGKCLQLMPRDRYTGVSALADDLRRLRDGLPVSVRTPGRIERLRRWYEREPRLVGAIAALLVAILLGTAGSVAGWRVAAEREQAAIADRHVAEQARRDAEAQRVRAQIASELGARLFSFEGETDDRAADLIRWLGQRLPGDEAAQAEVLTAFAESVSATGRATADNLMFEIIAVAGAEYRKQAKAALLAGESPDRFLHAAMLSWADIESEGGADEFHRLLGQAMQARPDDPRVWLVAAKNCPLGRCRYPEAAQRLIALDGDNMHAFIIAASLQDFGPGWDRLLHEAALREHNDDYLGREYQMFRDAIRTANVPPPPLLRRPLELLALDDDPTSVISFYEAGRSVTLASYSRLVLGCGVSPGSPRAAPDLRADCLAVGTRMMRTPGGLISRMIGVALVRNLADDKVLAQEALETRRLYSFLSEQLKIRGPIAQLQYPSSQYFEDLATRGEMVAMQRQVAHLGGQVEPPADWRPESSVSLLSARERFDLLRATDAEARRLLELKQYDQVLDQIVAFEARIGGRTIEPWLNARLWVTQARAEQALGKFEAAEATLKRAWGVVADFPPYTAEYGEALRAHVQLYQAWNAAAPGRGHDALLREWQQRLMRHDHLSTGR